MAAPPLGFYVHVPFCVVRCGYCDFNTYTAEELGDEPGASRATYAEAALAEVRFARAAWPGEDRPVSTVFFGGGTPTLLPPEDLTGILGGIDAAFGLAPDVEVTTEANPDSVSAEDLVRLREGGVNRISFGMQSAVRPVLAVLDRTHDPERVPRAVEWARELDPDLICITGDLLSRARGQAKLNELLARLPSDPYVVLGNHDFALSRDPFSEPVRLGSLERGRLLSDPSAPDDALRRPFGALGPDGFAAQVDWAARELRAGFGPYDRPPVVQFTDGTTLTLTYTEAGVGLDTTTPATGDFVIHKNGTGTVAVTAVAVDTVNKTVTLTLGSAVTNADTVTVDYTPGANKTQDIAGNGPGLGLLPLVTQFAPDKTVRHATVSFGELAGPWAPLSGLAVRGYEIHQGQTMQHAGMAAGRVALPDGLGWQNAQGNVLGVYLHGLFEDAGVLQALFGTQARTLESVFDGLADIVERYFATGVLPGLVAC